MIRRRHANRLFSASDRAPRQPFRVNWIVGRISKGGLWGFSPRALLRWQEEPQPRRML